MQKKVIIIVVLIVVIIAAALGGWRYYSTHKKDDRPAQVNGLVTHPNASGGAGYYTMCQYECGDGKCETTETACPPGSATCICSETHASCPQDCK